MKLNMELWNKEDVGASGTPETPDTPQNHEIDKTIDKSIDDAIEKSLAPMIERITASFEKRIGNISVTPSQKDIDKETKGGFSNIGELAQATMKFFRGGQIDPRCKALLRTDVGEDGGILIPSEFSNALFGTAKENSVIWKRVTNIPVNGNTVEMPAISDYSNASDTYYGGVKNYWVAEAKTGTEVAPQFDTIQLRLKDNMTLIPISNDLLQDSPVSIAPLIERLGTNALAMAMDNVFINGDGVGKPRGILNANAKVEVSQETSQTAATIVTANILKMYARFNQKYLKNAIWLGNQTIFTQLPILNTATYKTVWLPPTGISGQMYNTIFGIPLEFTEFCSALGTVGDIILCDPSSYLAIDKAQQTDWSKEVYFAYNKSLLRILYRVDGQMWQNKVHTPANGDTLAPIVTLGTRSGS